MITYRFLGLRRARSQRHTVIAMPAFLTPSGPSVAALAFVLDAVVFELTSHLMACHLMAYSRCALLSWITTSPYGAVASCSKILMLTSSLLCSRFFFTNSILALFSQFLRPTSVVRGCQHRQSNGYDMQQRVLARSLLEASGSPSNSDNLQVSSVP